MTSFSDDSFCLSPEDEAALKTLDSPIDSLSEGDLISLPLEEVPILPDPPLKEMRRVEFLNPLSGKVNRELHGMTPLEMFMFVIDEFCLEVAGLSTKYAESLGEKKIRISREDVEMYVLLFVFLSVFRMPDINLIWEERKAFGNVMAKLITKNEYRTINKYLCIFKNEDNCYGEKPKVKEGNRTGKINLAIDYFNKKWQKLFPYTKYLTIDESLTTFKGELIFKQSIKRKRKKMGIKFFTKASADKGYVYKVIPFSGDEFLFDEKMGIGASVVRDLAKGHEHQDFHFTFDTYYANLFSWKILYDSGIGFTCTFLRSRKALPDKVKKTDLPQGKSTLFMIRNTSIRMYLFHELKQVQLASSIYGVEKVRYANSSGQIKYKPEMIAYYNMTKAGVDLSDCATQIYKSQRKTYSWWKAVFFYLIDVSLNNCKICYLSLLSSRSSSVLPRNRSLFFRRVLLNQFIEYFHPGLRKGPGFLSFPEDLALHFPVPFRGRLPCFSCGSEGKGASSQRCRTCEVVLCEKCFPEFHKKREHERILGLKRQGNEKEKEEMKKMERID